MFPHSPRRFSPGRALSLSVTLSTFVLCFTALCFLVLAGVLTGCGSEGDSGPEIPDAADPEFIVGHAPLDSTDPGEFVPLQDGATLPIGRGNQGSYMSILCIKTRGALSADIDIEAELRSASDASIIAFRGTTGQRLTPADDGYDYHMNFWLISSLFDAEFTGKEATLRITVTDDRGMSESAEMAVELREISFFR